MSICTGVRMQKQVYSFCEDVLVIVEVASVHPK